MECPDDEKNSQGIEPFSSQSYGDTHLHIFFISDFLACFKFFKIGLGSIQVAADFVSGYPVF